MIKRTKLGYLWALQVQYGGLLVSASMFDVGHTGESARMANAMYILLGPTTKNHVSIVSQLAFKEPLQITSTARSAIADANGSSPLAAVELVPYVRADGSSGGWIINAVANGSELLSLGARTSSDLWWSQKVLTSPVGQLSRLDVVRIVRDRDGGAHLDSSIAHPAYEAVLLRGVGYKYKHSAEGPERHVEGMIEATIRQMAAEVLHSLQSLNLTAKHELSSAVQKRPLSELLFDEET